MENFKKKKKASKQQQTAHHFRMLVGLKGEKWKGRGRAVQEVALPVPSAWSHWDHSASELWVQQGQLKQDCHDNLRQPRGGTEATETLRAKLKNQTDTPGIWCERTKKKKKKMQKGGCWFKFSLTSTVIWFLLTPAWACLVNWINQTTCSQLSS